MRIFPAILLLFALAAGAAEPELLEPQQAFRFSARMLDASSVEVRYQIAPGYYLYRDKLKFSAEPAQIRLDTSRLPLGKIKKDEFFGEVQIYRGDLRVVLPVAVEGQPVTDWVLSATSQGCADIGVCYAPQESRADLKLVAAMSSAGDGGVSALLQPAPGMAPGATLPRLPAQSEDARIAELFRGGFGLLIASFFGFGLLLAFTPCVFPMIPILSGILIPHGERLTHMRGFLLSLAYVLGMAITYAVAGVVAGLVGTMLSSALQNPWVLGAFAIVFVVLALSMFGLYELQMPVALQTRLASASSHLHGGHFASVFAMGILSALIVGPCVAAPLAGALLYIGQSGNTVLGGAALFAMALGMGAPLLVVGASTGALLPKSGPWLENVKKVFGVVLLGVAIYLISPVVPAAVHLLLWAALLIVSAIYLHAVDPLPHDASGLLKLWKGIGVIALLAGVALLVGALSGGRDVLQPLSGLRVGAAPIRSPTLFQRVNNVDEFTRALRAAQGKPVMLDFYADWCVSCKEMERDTFSAPPVQSRLAQIVKMQADVTENTAEDQALLKRFGLFGPPGMLFFDRHGSEIRALRVIGFEDADKFAATLDQVLR